MKVSYTVKITLNEEYSERLLMKAMRKALKNMPLWEGLPCNRQAVKVKKVTVRN